MLLVSICYFSAFSDSDRGGGSAYCSGFVSLASDSTTQLAGTGIDEEYHKEVNASAQRPAYMMVVMVALILSVKVMFMVMF